MPPYDWGKLYWNTMLDWQTISEPIGKRTAIIKIPGGIKFEFEKIPTISDLIKEMEKKVQHEGKILIMVDKNDHNKVIARDLVTGKTAEAKCHKNDEFDFNTGAKLAFERLMEEKPKYWNGKVVCIKYEGIVKAFTIGKVYSVIDGYILDNNNDVENPYTGEVLSLLDLNDKAYPFAEFIEYKGDAEE